MLFSNLVPESALRRYHSQCSRRFCGRPPSPKLRMRMSESLRKLSTSPVLGAILPQEKLHPGRWPAMLRLGNFTSW